MSLPEPDSFLSGDAGDVTAPWRRLKRSVAERGLRAGRPGDRHAPHRGRRPLARPRGACWCSASTARGRCSWMRWTALRSERHQVRLRAGRDWEPDPLLPSGPSPPDLAGGKFENLNRLLGARRPGSSPTGRSWSTTTSSCRRISSTASSPCATPSTFELAQPAQTLAQPLGLEGRPPAPGLARPADRASWRSARSPASGPRWRRRAAALPRAALRLGARPALGGARGPAGLAPGGRGRRAGASRDRSGRDRYRTQDAVDEARRFLSGRPYLPRPSVAAEVLATHRRAP